MKITYNELFYLGTLLGAKYIDYNYYSAIDDIDSEKDLLLDNSKNSLISKGLLMQDFSGNTSVDDALEKLVNPIFFSLKEVEIDVFTKDNSEEYTVVKFHYSDDAITMVKLADTDCEISDFDNNFDGFVNSLNLFDKTENTSEESDGDFSEDDIYKMIIVKNVDANISARSTTFIMTETGIFKANNDETLSSITGDELKESVKNTLQYKEV